eukprot:2539653-Heterocapsa_arctica.AAC.1
MAYHGAQRRQELRRLQRRELPFLRVCEHVFAAQLARRQHALAEDPWASSAWSEAPMRRVIDMPG